MPNGAPAETGTLRLVVTEGAKLGAAVFGDRSVWINRRVLIDRHVWLECQVWIHMHSLQK